MIKYDIFVCSRVVGFNCLDRFEVKMARAAIEDILQYDSIYRSDAAGYARFRRYFLERGMKHINRKYRDNTYLPLRILLLETTRKRATHGLNDLWMMLHMTRKKSTTPKEAVPQEVDTSVWHQMSEPLNAPSPVSDLHFSPVSRDYFAFSTIDGSLHFGRIESGLKLGIVATVKVPSISFLKFKWANQNLIIGLGFTSSVFVMSSDAHLWELRLQSEPSEIESYWGIPNSCVVGDRTGSVVMCDLSQTVKNIGSVAEFRQPTAATISRVETDITKVYNVKKSISSLHSPANSECLLVGTSDGDVFVIGVEVRHVKKWRTARDELRCKSVQIVSMPTLVKGLKSASVDSISAMLLGSTLYMFVNTRSESGALLSSDDIANEIKVVKEFRVPSLRAKCPVGINAVGDAWMWVAGTDMGDVIIGERGEDLAIVALHESSISVVEWVPRSRVFIAADVAGVLSIWTRS